MEVNRMRRSQAFEIDNRDSSEMYGYLEARIEAMKRRIVELEMENATLRCELEDSRELMSVCA
jgi:regulator of replication initiation timing